MSSFSNSRKICIRRFSSIASQRRSQARKRLANSLGGAYKCQKLIKRGSIIFVFSPTVHPKGSLQFCELWSTAYGCGLEREIFFVIFFCFFSFIGFLLSNKPSNDLLTPYAFIDFLCRLSKDGDKITAFHRNGCAHFAHFCSWRPKFFGFRTLKHKNSSRQPHRLP